MQSKIWIVIGLSLFVITSALAQTVEEKELPDILTGIPKAPKSLVIDGELGEWPLSVAIFVSEKSTQQLEDCSGIFYMMWDKDNLYFAAKVYDDELIQGKVGDLIHLEDDVQFDLDLDREGDILVSVYTDDDFQLGFSPGDFDNDGPEMWGWNPGGAGRLMERPQNAEIASSNFDDGWIIEARIGVDEFNSDLTGIAQFEEGMKMGFGRAINDYDIQSGDGGVSSGGAWQDTSKMYDVQLIGLLSVEPRLKIIESWGLIKSKD
ncbi:sugar-binding protein [Candidatus Poribacteria bacterium]